MGQEIGDWDWWREAGPLVCRATYDEQGRLHGYQERYHPNGEISQWASWCEGAAHGVQGWCKVSEGETDEVHPVPPNIPQNVMRMEMAYVRGDPVHDHFTLYNRRGLLDPVPQDEHGRSLSLGDHAQKLEVDTTLRLLSDTFTTVDDETIDASATWDAGSSSAVRRIAGVYATELRTERPPSSP